MFTHQLVRGLLTYIIGLDALIIGTCASHAREYLRLEHDKQQRKIMRQNRKHIHDQY